VNLRQMTLDDMPAVMALEQELFPEDAWPPEMFANELAEVAEATGSGRRRYLVAVADATVTGYAGMLFSDGAEADVLTLAVDPGNWGQGIGTALLEALLDEAAQRKCAQVFLEVRKDNPRAQSLYRRHGFIEIGVRRGYYQPSGTDAIVMRKDLDK
jgi:[ribosomal protein S18]-alanine N-acetyltransferase